MNSPHVYFDNNATSPLDPRVFEAMRPWLQGQHGNPSSVHIFGQQARTAVELARAQVAELIGAEPLEIVFTASGTEANVTVLESCLADGGHLVVSELEHPSILSTAEWLEGRGVTVSRIPPGSDGTVDPDRFVAALREDTRLAVLMLANNELGTVQPVPQVAAQCRERGVPLLCDAVQAAGKITVSCSELGADFVVLAAHKFHGPLGAAALRVRGGVQLKPLLRGGGQERQRRAGTENVAALVGLGRTCELARLELDDRARLLGALRRCFEQAATRIEGVEVHCQDSPRLPHTSHIAALGTVAQDLVIRLDMAGFAVSMGAACASGAVEPSRVVLALGTDPAEALASLRVSFGMFNTLEEVDAFVPALEREIRALRGATPGAVRAS